MVGVAENDLRVELLELPRGDPFDRAPRADRHEHRRLDGAVRRLQRAAARGALAMRHREGEFRHGSGYFASCCRLLSGLAGPTPARPRSATPRLARAAG